MDRPADRETIMPGSLRSSAANVVAALLTGLAGFMAFNVFDTVLGVSNAIVGLVAWAALTVFVYRRSPPAGE
jgi:uncharacterized membrane protein YuzA (DUF378 family)